MNKNDRMRKIDLFLSILVQTSLHSVSFAACIKGIVESGILFVKVFCSVCIIIVVTIYIFLISLIIADYIDDKNENKSIEVQKWKALQLWMKIWLP